ncbi:MAG: hypothetical protein AAF415_07290 [Pseudomonadota bacterium]
MAKYSIGDLVVLKSGSMRMCVEGVDETADTVSTVWCNEGVIGRDTFATVLLNKWEVREEKSGGGRPYGGDREGGGKPYRGGDRGGDRGGPRHDRGGDRGGDRPHKQGWDGKPREKKYYRKDD